MRIELTPQTPAGMGEDWPGQFDTFSTLEPRVGIPSGLFLVTTRKENGKANACFHGWSCFAGDTGGYYAILAGLMPGGHTHRNILRDRVFCVNFMAPAYLEACERTIAHNGEADDELAAAGLTEEPAVRIAAPRVREAFLCLECELTTTLDPSGLGQMQVLIGRTVHAAMEDTYRGVEGFMAYQYACDNPAEGLGRRSRFAVLRPLRED